MTMNVIDEWFGAFRERNIDSAPLAEDFTHTSPFGIVAGRQAYLDTVAANAAAFYGPDLEIVDTVESADVSVVRYLMDGTPATDWVYSRDGEITAIYSYYHLGPPPSF